MRTTICLAAVTLLWVVTPAFGQPTQEVGKLLEKGHKLLDDLPEIPSDLREEYFYTIIEKDEKVGWKQIRLDSITKRGETYYRYRARYGIDSITFGLARGEMSVILDRKLTPIDLRNEMFFINPRTGKREIEDRARIKNDAFRRRIFDGRQTIKRKFDLQSARVSMLVEPLVGKLKFEEGEKVAFLDYDIFLGVFRTLVCEAKEKEDDKQKVELEVRVVVDDPNQAERLIIESPPVPIPEESNVSSRGQEKQKYHMLINPDKSLHYVFDPVYKLESRLSDKEEAEVVKKDLVITTDDIPTT